MEAAGETCKLCLKYIQGANLAVLDETLLGKLEFLQMDLDQSVEESNSVCKECEEKIENAFDFKSCLVNTESCLVPYVSEDKTQKVNLRVIVEKDSPSTSAGESSAEKEVCRLCKNFVDANSVISLPKILKDDSMIEVFQGHIPEMDLEVTENPVVCDSCHKSLASFSTLIASWSIANGWNDDEDMKEDFDDFEMIQVKKENLDDLSDSNTNSSTGILDISDSAKTFSKAKSKNGKDVKVKKESEELSDSSESVSVKNVKKEDEDGVGDSEMAEDLQLKSEEVEIKDEDGKTSNRTGTAGHPTAHIMSGDRKISSNTTAVLKCIICSYQTTQKPYLKVHMRTHYPPSIKCTLCPFLAYSTRRLNKHIKEIHENIVIMFNCDKCSYQTKRKYDMSRHQKTHDSKNIYKCTECLFQIKGKSNFESHKRVHKKRKLLYKCESCIFQTKYKCEFEQHKTHIVRQKGHRCPHCPYDTLRKSSFEIHMKGHETYFKKMAQKM